MCFFVVLFFFLLFSALQRNGCTICTYKYTLTRTFGLDGNNSNSNNKIRWWKETRNRRGIMETERNGRRRRQRQQYNGPKNGNSAHVTQECRSNRLRLLLACIVFGGAMSICTVRARCVCARRCMCVSVKTKNLFIQNFVLSSVTFKVVLYVFAPFHRADTVCYCCIHTLHKCCCCCRCCSHVYYYYYLKRGRAKAGSRRLQQQQAKT